MKNAAFLAKCLEGYDRATAPEGYNPATQHPSTFLAAAQELRSLAALRTALLEPSDEAAEAALRVFLDAGEPEHTHDNVERADMRRAIAAANAEILRGLK